MLNVHTDFFEHLKSGVVVEVMQTLMMIRGLLAQIVVVQRANVTGDQQGVPAQEMQDTTNQQQLFPREE